MYHCSSETFNKSEIAEKLEEYLNAHPQLSSDSRVASFFNRRSVSSPVKKEASAAAESASDAIKVVKRKTTKAASDIKDAVVASLPLVYRRGCTDASYRCMLTSNTVMKTR